jgi:CheY-like chemotaxis protein
MGQAVSERRPVVLVVEDEHLLRQNAVEMVEEAGFAGVAAADADEAIRILQTRSDIRVVFTDIHMPGSMDGLELARVVRRRWSSVALIVTSGRIAVPQTALPIGGSFLHKPYVGDQIAELLRKLVD